MGAPSSPSHGFIHCTASVNHGIDTIGFLGERGVVFGNIDDGASRNGTGVGHRGGPFSLNQPITELN